MTKQQYFEFHAKKCAEMVEITNCGCGAEAVAAKFKSIEEERQKIIADENHKEIKQNLPSHFEITPFETQYLLLEQACCIASSKSKNSLKRIAIALDLCDKQARALKIARDCLIMCKMVMRGHESGLDESCERNLTAIDEILKCTPP